MAGRSRAAVYRSALNAEVEQFADSPDVAAGGEDLVEDAVLAKRLALKVTSFQEKDRLTAMSGGRYAG